MKLARLSESQDLPGHFSHKVMNMSANLSDSVTLMLVDVHKVQSHQQNHTKNLDKLQKNSNDNMKSIETVQNLCAGNFIESKVVELLDPSSSEVRQYFVFSPYEYSISNIHEIQCMQNEDDFGSFFIGSRVISDGNFRISSRVDPLYFLLSNLDPLEGSPKWEPLDQALSKVSIYVRNSLRAPVAKNDLEKEDGGPKIDIYPQICHLFERSDEYGDDMILYKFSPTKACNWMIKKFNCVTDTIEEHMLKAKRESHKEVLQSSYGRKNASFNNSFIVEEDEEPNATLTDMDLSKINLTEEEKQMAKDNGLQLICEYLSNKWRRELLKKLDLSADALLTLKERKRKAQNQYIHDGGEGNNDPTSSHEQKNDSTRNMSGEDEEKAKLLHYTMGLSTRDGDDEDNVSNQNAAKKARVTNAQSYGSKQLKKVNTKGMKSLSSFFGVKKNKKIN